MARNLPSTLPLLGLDNIDLTITQLKQLSRMALLCFANDKPEPEWFDSKYLEQVQETVSKAKELYQEYSTTKNRLEETYSDGIYELDLDGLIERYSVEYRSSLKIFNSTYRNDQKQISRLTNDGKVPKTIQQDLIDARKVKKLLSKIDASAENVRTMMGHYYHKTRTDFQGAEKALAITDEINKLSWGTQIPEVLLKLLTSSSNPSPMIKNLGMDLQESVGKWEQQAKNLESLIPQKIPKSDAPISQTSLSMLEEWASETEKQLNPLNELTKDTLSTSIKEPQTYKQLIKTSRTLKIFEKKKHKSLAKKSNCKENLAAASKN